jgi:hypothetical protein
VFARQRNPSIPSSVSTAQIAENRRGELPFALSFRTRRRNTASVGAKNLSPGTRSFKYTSPYHKEKKS